MSQTSYKRGEVEGGARVDQGGGVTCDGRTAVKLKAEVSADGSEICYDARFL